HLAGFQPCKQRSQAHEQDHRRCQNNETRQRHPVLTVRGCGGSGHQLTSEGISRGCLPLWISLMSASAARRPRKVASSDSAPSVSPWLRMAAATLGPKNTSSARSARCSVARRFSSSAAAASAQEACHTRVAAKTRFSPMGEAGGYTLSEADSRPSKQSSSV